VMAMSLGFVSPKHEYMYPREAIRRP